MIVDDDISLMDEIEEPESPLQISFPVSASCNLPSEEEEEENDFINESTQQIRHHLEEVKEESIEQSSVSCSTDISSFHNERHGSQGKSRSDVPRLFACKLCPKLFRTKDNLAQHQTSHSTARPFMCDLCGKWYKSRSIVLDHKKRVHSSYRPHKCDLCGTGFLFSSHLKKHMSVHDEKKENQDSFSCKYCGKEFEHKKSLVGHYAIHSREIYLMSNGGAIPNTANPNLAMAVSNFLQDPARTFQCHICPKAFKSKDNLMSHLSVHSDARPYQCQLCLKTYKLKSALLVHHKRSHSDDRPHKCHLCDAKFLWRSLLQIHMLNHGQPRYQCDICQKRFANKYRLKSHRDEVHFYNARANILAANSLGGIDASSLRNVVRSYQCEICRKSFKAKETLMNHMVVHSNDRPFQCTQCGNTYKFKTALLVHYKRAHSTERPHKCQYCGASFLYRSYLKHHMLVHTKPGLFRCHFCHRRFTYKYCLKEHLKNIHNAVYNEINPRITDDHSKQIESIQDDVPGASRSGLGESNFSPDPQQRQMMMMYHILKPHRCTFCVRAYKTRKALSRHIRQVHSSYLPHKCTLCDMRFNSKAVLNQHLWTHQMPSLNQCGLCSKIFANKYAVRRHLRKVHKQNLTSLIRSKNPGPNDPPFSLKTEDTIEDEILGEIPALPSDLYKETELFHNINRLPSVLGSDYDSMCKNEPVVFDEATQRFALAYENELLDSGLPPETEFIEPLTEEPKDCKLEAPEHDGAPESTGALSLYQTRDDLYGNLPVYPGQPFLNQFDSN